MSNPADKYQAIDVTTYSTAASLASALVTLNSTSLEFDPRASNGNMAVFKGYTLQPTKSYSVLDTTGQSLTAIAAWLSNQYANYPNVVFNIAQYIAVSS